MKIFLTILTAIVSVFLFSFKDHGSKGKYLHSRYDTIPSGNRAGPSLYARDARLFPIYNSNLPIYFDTTQANTLPTPGGTTALGNDYVGAKIYTLSPQQEWVRKSNGISNYWFASQGFTPTASCGIVDGTGVVTWDSLLVFDVSAAMYTLCCDSTPHQTNDTVITLPAADPDNPTRFAIIAGTNGIEILQGTAAAEPGFPQLTTCQILLQYILVNAGQTTPAVIDPVLTIYDTAGGIAGGEWDTLAVTTNANFNDDQHPVHLTKDILVTSGIGYLEFTSPNNINLNDYGALKLYIRLNQSGTVKFNFSWYLDGVQQTSAFQIPDSRLSFSAGVLNSYQTIVIPTSAFLVLGTATVNKLRISYPVTNFYIDWIQLQMGINPGLPQHGLTQLTIDTLQNFAAFPIINPNTTPHVIPTLLDAPAYRLWGNDQAISGTPDYVQVDLGTSMVTGFLPPALISPDGSDGDYLAQIGGVVQFTPFENDTTFIENWLYRSTDPLSNNDTLRYGSRYRDSATLKFNTLNSLNSFSWTITQGATDVFKINPSSSNAFITVGGSRFEEALGTTTAAANNLTLPNNGNTIFLSGNTQVNAITTANWQSGSDVTLIMTGTPTFKQNTAGGAGTATLLLAGSVDFVAAAGDLISFKYDGINWHETQRKLTATTGSQTLQQTFNTEVGGSVLTKSDTISNGAFSLKLIGTTAAPGILNIQNSGASGYGIYTVMTGANSIGIEGQTLNATGNGTGIIGSSAGSGSQNIGGDFNASGASVSNVAGNFNSSGTAAIGVKITSGATGINLTASGTAIISIVQSSGTNDILLNSQFIRTTGGSAANGIGVRNEFLVETSDGTNQISNQFISDWEVVTTGSRTSKLIVNGVLSAATVNVLTMYSSGPIQLRPITAAAASAITPAEGMMLFVSDTDGTFLSIGFWGYQNGAWAKM